MNPLRSEDPRQGKTKIIGLRCNIMQEDEQDEFDSDEKFELEEEESTGNNPRFVFNAKEARERSNTAKKKAADKQMKAVMKGIKEAIEGGQMNATISFGVFQGNMPPVMRTQLDAVRMILEENEYGFSYHMVPMEDEKSEVIVEVQW